MYMHRKWEKKNAGLHESHILEKQAEKKKCESQDSLSKSCSQEDWKSSVKTEKWSVFFFSFLSGYVKTTINKILISYISLQYVDQSVCRHWITYTLVSKAEE